MIELQYIHTEQMFVIVCESKMMIARYLFVENYANCTFYDETILQRQREEILIKYICMIKINMKLNINFQLIKEKVQD